MDADKQVTDLLAAIEEEKRQPKPDKKQMRQWFKQVWQLKEDWRSIHTGQDNRFQTHTSMRPWSDSD